MTLQNQIGKEQAFSTPEEHVYIALRRAAWNVSAQVGAVYASGGFTASQYNVLRILRGHHPARLTASDIAPLMVSRDSDLTRILTELQKRGLVSRRRCSKDRRRIWISITKKGLAALEQLDKPVVETIRSSLSALDAKALGRLTKLLEPLCDSD